MGELYSGEPNDSPQDYLPEVYLPEALVNKDVEELRRKQADLRAERISFESNDQGDPVGTSFKIMEVDREIAAAEAQILGLIATQESLTDQTTMPPPTQTEPE